VYPYAVRPQYRQARHYTDVNGNERIRLTETQEAFSIWLCLDLFEVPGSITSFLPTRLGRGMIRLRNFFCPRYRVFALHAVPGKVWLPSSLKMTIDYRRGTGLGVKPGLRWVPPRRRCARRAPTSEQARDAALAVTPRDDR